MSTSTFKRDATATNVGYQQTRAGGVTSTITRSQPAPVDTDAYLDTIITSAPKKQPERQPTMKHSSTFERNNYGAVNSDIESYRRPEYDSCGHKCCKGMLYFVNAAILLAGLGILVLALITTKLATSDEAKALSNAIIEYAVIGAACVLIFFAVFGMFTARWPNRCLLIMYLIVMILLTIVVVGVSVILILAASNQSWLNKVGDASWGEAPQDVICKLENTYNCTGWGTACQAGANATNVCPLCPVIGENGITWNSTTPGCSKTSAVCPFTVESCESKLHDKLQDKLNYLLKATGSACGTLVIGMIATIWLVKAKRMIAKERDIYGSGL